MTQQSGNNDDAGHDGLTRLGERLKEAESRARGDIGDEKEDRSGLAAAYRMGIELVVGVVVGLVIGLALDGFFGTKPVFMIVFIFLGFGAGIRNIMKDAQNSLVGLHEDTEQDKCPGKDVVDKTED